MKGVNLCTGMRVLSFHNSFQLSTQIAFSTLTNLQVGGWRSLASLDYLSTQSLTHQLPKPGKVRKVQLIGGAATFCYLFNFSHSGFLYNLANQLPAPNLTATNINVRGGMKRSRRRSPYTSLGNVKSYSFKYILCVAKRKCTVKMHISIHVYVCMS